ncbi:hypothetical protein [Glycocaulis alkaliphilus]|nr:hypothetical protein [Glycocaulis alkaliphilus]GGB79080.1 hypothetical protein GCM10007417_18750 [Glycocaulis alkaliphilus]
MAFARWMTASGAALIMAACAAAPAPSLQPSRALPGERETIHYWQDMPDGSIRVQVRSNGCTTKESFEPVVMVDSRTRWTFTVELRRLQPDHCRAFLPEGVELVWSRDELGLPGSASVRVINPQAPTPRPRR